MSPNVDQALRDCAVSRVTKGKAIVASVFCLIVASPNAASAASAGVPTVDIATTCRESERAITSIFGAGVQQTFDSCMKQENEARGQIVKNWRSYPSGGRQRCVNTTGYMPSYVEWLTCLEMEQSVEALRRSNSETTRPSSTKPATTEGRSER